jgi:hypothetical protein
MSHHHLWHKAQNFLRAREFLWAYHASVHYVVTYGVNIILITPLKKLRIHLSGLLDIMTVTAKKSQQATIANDIWELSPTRQLLLKTISHLEQLLRFFCRPSHHL